MNVQSREVPSAVQCPLLGPATSTRTLRLKCGFELPPPLRLNEVEKPPELAVWHRSLPHVREAADQALEQLVWLRGYLHSFAFGQTQPETILASQDSSRRLISIGLHAQPVSA
jgi:hypothetical protein